MFNKEKTHHIYRILEVQKTTENKVNRLQAGFTVMNKK